MNIQQLIFSLSRISVVLVIIQLLGGCTAGMFSLEGGIAKFSIPFDFPQPEKQRIQERKMLEEMQRLQEEEGIELYDAGGLDRSS